MIEAAAGKLARRLDARRIHYGWVVALAFAAGAAARRRAELVAALLVLAAASVLVSLIPPL